MRRSMAEVRRLTKVRPDLAPPGESYPWLEGLFFLSGFPALIYQIVWQRSLFTIYGVNIESVTMVVTAFMLGLGLGSLVGGLISKSRKLPLLALFGCIELGIATYGLVSLRIFHWAARLTVGAPPLKTGILSLLLVIVPTILMGSTLPLLVAYLVRVSSNVGSSVGRLYFANTFGSALACFITAGFTMRMLGQSGSVNVAVAMNVCIGTAVLVFYWRERKRRPESQKSASLQTQLVSTTSTGVTLPLALGMLTAGLCGFIALGYEIVWYRLFSFTTAGSAKSFAVMLGAYLGGIAFGSSFSGKICQSQSDRKQRYLLLIAAFIILANFLGFLVAPLLAFSVRWAGLAGALPLIGAAAVFLGATFPLIAHISVPPDANAGARLSYLYLSNIVGAASGSFLVGFILMDYWGIQNISIGLALAGVSIGGAVLLAAHMPVARLVPALAVCTLVGSFIVIASSSLFDHIYEKLQLKAEWSGTQPFKYVVENKSGVITVSQDGTVFGGGIYDGRFNTDLVHDSNLVVRAFALSSLHSAPKQVLMIGLSSGSWAQVIANHPQIEKLTIIEINPGYLQLIPKYPQVASLLRNPKVEITIDDGRRWLARNPGKKFDVIVMNTTYHWRANVSNVLSREFLGLVRQHLNPGGIHYYNTTEGKDVFLTGTTVFPYSVRVMNFLAVSDSPIQIDVGRWKKVLLEYQVDERPLLDLSRDEDRTRLAEILALPDHGDSDHPLLQPRAIEHLERFALTFPGGRIITDDNMGTEWQ